MKLLQSLPVRHRLGFGSCGLRDEGKVELANHSQQEQLLTREGWQQSATKLTAISKCSLMHVLL